MRVLIWITACFCGGFFLAAGNFPLSIISFIISFVALGSGGNKKSKEKPKTDKNVTSNDTGKKPGENPPLSYDQNFNIGFFGPSRIGKTTMLAAMVEEFKKTQTTSSRKTLFTLSFLPLTTLQQAS